MDFAGPSHEVGVLPGAAVECFTVVRMAGKDARAGGRSRLGAEECADQQSRVNCRIPHRTPPSSGHTLSAQNSLNQFAKCSIFGGERPARRVPRPKRSPGPRRPMTAFGSGPTSSGSKSNRPRSFPQAEDENPFVAGLEAVARRQLPHRASCPRRSIQPSVPIASRADSVLTSRSVR